MNCKTCEDKSELKCGICAGVCCMNGCSSTRWHVILNSLYCDKCVKNYLILKDCYIIVDGQFMYINDDNRDEMIQPADIINNEK